MNEYGDAIDLLSENLIWSISKLIDLLPEQSIVREDLGIELLRGMKNYPVDWERLKREVEK